PSGGGQQRGGASARARVEASTGDGSALSRRSLLPSRANPSPPVLDAATHRPPTHGCMEHALPLAAGTWLPRRFGPCRCKGANRVEHGLPASRVDGLDTGEEEPDYNFLNDEFED
ncbi:unnamed protein product, partial [Urochloa humidicola]